GVMRQQTLTATAQVFAAAAGPATASHNSQEAFRALRAIARVPDIRYAEIRAMDETVLASLGNGSRLTRDVSLERNQAASVLHLLTSASLQPAVPIMNGGEPAALI